MHAPSAAYFYEGVVSQLADPTLGFLFNLAFRERCLCLLSLSFIVDCSGTSLKNFKQVPTELGSKRFAEDIQFQCVGGFFHLLRQVAGTEPGKLTAIGRAVGVFTDLCCQRLERLALANAICDLGEPLTSRRLVACDEYVSRESLPLLTEIATLAFIELDDVQTIRRASWWADLPDFEPFDAVYQKRGQRILHRGRTRQQRPVCVAGDSVVAR